jgi:hypothetical protein
MPDAVKITLNPKGYISSVVEKLDSCLTDFYSAEYSQTTLYKGNVASIQWIIQNKRNNPTGTAELVERTLRDYLTRHFHEALVSCSAIDDPDSKDRAALRLGITVKNAAGESATIREVVKMLDSKFISVVRENNG